MKILEVRRHSYTKKGAKRGKGSHLSEEGVRLARALGETIGQCEQVFTGVSPRALETAIAMGYAVDEQLPILGDFSAEMVQEVGHHERWSWEEPFKVFRQIMATGGATAQVGQQLRETWQTLLEAASPDGKILIISSGRLLEIGLLACLPDAQIDDWGTSFQHGEGFRLGYEAGHFHNLELLRV